MAILTALQNKFKAPSATNVDVDKLACHSNCANCFGKEACFNHRLIEADKKMHEEIERAEKLKKAEEAKRLAALKKQEGGND